MIKIYHNPRCSKSRQTLEIIQNSGQQPEVVEYLKTPPTASELKELLQMLNLKPEQLLRIGEQLYKDKYKNEQLSDEELIQVMAENPVLIERPIVVKDNKAVLGRPPENVLDIL
ncbi:arsenate reductase (glutaredoxin) [Pontibacter cellulosilyticus]|uniref:Arsenate reductase (Glutaredoxin) n=1 Tax=Pontibacter cellulosilyticus TaxID=1720253 RepID=A0A923SHZ7_9BACT|nr:arsenate reductase (glutaredoxin) [Pontibacter cellulosilyticus]MBC5992077.1 arsenate reductase (glutaredoxin) [Pontibacter cellulosilyticus]